MRFYTAAFLLIGFSNLAAAVNCSYGYKNLPARLLKVNFDHFDGSHFSGTATVTLSGATKKVSVSEKPIVREDELYRIVLAEENPADTIGLLIYKQKGEGDVRISTAINPSMPDFLKRLDGDCSF